MNKRLLHLSIFINICLQAIIFITVEAVNTPMNQSDCAPFVIFTPPKTGTHLCSKTLSLISGKAPAFHIYELPKTTLEIIQLALKETDNQHFIVAHTFQAEDLNMLAAIGYKIIFLIRDPRDHLLSALDWMHEGEWAYIPVNQINDPVEQLTDLITGEKKRFPYVDFGFLAYERHIKNIPPANLYITHFEKLVGSKGNGSDEEQEEEILKLANFIGKDITAEEAREIGKNVFGGTRTFRKGTINQWKTRYNPEQKRIFKERYNTLLIRLGYEKDDTWN